MVDGEMEVVVVLEVREGVARVMLPDTSVEAWSVASLPAGAVAGDRLGITVTDGEMEMEVLPVRGLKA